ncbi:Oidioi.mRNA.OKI2018_I69.chr2.g5140.t1.cds [Oikopleura dioica]|uniref:Oidioi.mRNA.OKI2018_I69.chr2.g5140.t1.cds n=1 Tax=Oikopleura dioica TaxID=34765 RepID=A0ABN7T3V3_OIKDI|nr:Oidioi.mRNA.OKI2018_I69.chr2.g5140.t1.cds [Oikopleura dioica]
MLYPKENRAEKRLEYCCRNCGYKSEAENPCIYVNKLISKMDELVGIVPEVSQDPALPRTDSHECPSCGNRGVCFFQSMLVKTMSMKLFYCCNTCSHRWTDY